MTARRPKDGASVYVRRETAERLRAAAEERVMGIHALADRLLTVGLDSLAPVDAYGRPVEPAPADEPGPPPRPGEPTMCLLDHECSPECPPRPDADHVYKEA